jgi:Lon protease-like protein
MSKFSTIPIFPLPLVVLPTEPQLLHIFEDRYKELVEHCRQTDTDPDGDFGILFVSDNELSDIGASVRLTSILKEYEDGRMEIMTHGQRRFRLLNIVRIHSYDSAEVEFFEDDQRDWDEALATKAFTLHRRLFKMVNGQFPCDASYSGKTSLAIHIAQSSGLSYEQKQIFLGLCCENIRLKFLIQHFNEIIPEIDRVEELKHKIQDNWCLQQYFKKLQADEPC